MIAAMSAITIFTSCRNDDTAVAPVNYSGKMTRIELSLSQPEDIVVTRSFFDDVDAASAWEYSFSCNGLMIFDTNGNNVFQTNVSAGSGNNTSTVSVPAELCGTTCRLYVFANFMSVPNSITTEAQLLAYSQVPNSASVYNVTQGDLMFSKTRSWIPMVGMKDVQIMPYGFKTYVDIELERLMAKIALEVSVADDFSDTHDGATIVINSAALTNYANGSYWVYRPGLYYTGLNSTSQTPRVVDKYSQFLWYSYETGASSNPYILIKGSYYYAPGTAPTPVEFTVPVTQTGGGAIERNHYYRIEAVISGVGERNLDMAFTARAWGVPPVDNVDIQQADGSIQ